MKFQQKAGKRLTSLLLVIVLCIMLFPTAVFADGELPTVHFTSDDNEKYAGFELYLGQNNANTKIKGPTSWQFTAGGTNLIRIETYTANSTPKFGGLLGFTVSSGTDESDTITVDSTVTLPTTATTILLGTLSTAENNKIQYYQMGSGKLRLQYTCYAGDPDITVKWIFNAEQSGFTCSADVGDPEHGTATATPTTTTNVYELTATPNDGYMLDYWVWKTDVDEDYPDDDEHKIENPVDNSKATITVTVPENRTYLAVFKFAAPFLFGGAVKTQYINYELWPTIQANLGITYEEWYRSRGYGDIKSEDQNKPSESIAEFKEAYLILDLDYPYRFLLSEQKPFTINLYEGEKEDSKVPFATVYQTEGYLPAALDGSSYPVIVQQMPYMTYFTVEAFVAGEGTSTAIYTLQSPVTPDPLSAEKKAALEELKNSYEDYRDTAEITEIQIEQLDVIYKQGRINIIDAATGAMITAKKNGAMQEMAAVLIDGETGLYVAVTVEAFTAIQGLIVKPTLVQISGETTVFKAIQRALASTYPDVALDELTIGSSYIAAVYLPGYTGTTNGENYLGQKDVGTDSGWVYCVDCVVPNVGVGVKKVSGGETVRLQYTVGGYGADVQPASDKDDLIMAMAQLRKIYSDEQLEGTATENKLTDEQLEAYSDAYALVNRLFADASDIDAADTALRAAFEEVFAPVDPAVKNVIDLIKAIGEVTLDSEDAIYAALDAYDKLTDAQKAKVRNYQTLVEAKDRYEELLNISSHDPDDALSGVLDYLAANVTDPVVNSQNGEWAVLAMARGGVLPDETREAYLSNLDAALDGSSITLWTEYERITLALSSMGIDASAYGETNLTENFKDYLAPAERPSVNQTLMVDIYALLALNAKPYASDSRDDYISRILAAEKDDGGWNHDETSDTADVDTSAMAIQALAPYYGENEGVTDAVGRALSWLKTKQDPYTGGYGEAGVVNTESTAQVVTALCALGIDPSGEEWTLTADGEELTPLSALTVWYDEAKGRFGHNSTGFDQMATEQAAYALVAWKRFSEDDYSLYDMQDMFPSNDTSVISLTVKELEAVPGENGTFTVELPGGTDLTTLTAADFTITAAAGATWTAPASEDNGVTWTFKVTAEDGTTKKDYTVTVTVAEVPVTDITLDLSEASVVEGETVTLTATVSPDNATDPTVTWTSSNEDVATVVDGVVTGVKAGTATITAKAGEKTATCEVTVTAAEVPVTDIALNLSEASVVEGATVTLTATVSPDNATDPTVTWSSSNEEVATVVDGVVTGVKAGTATITAKAGEKTATCAVTVTAAEVPVTDITLNQSEASVVEGAAVTLTATVSPDNATDPAVTWSSSNEEIATVVDGVVTGVKAGTATITAKAGEKTATCAVTVTAAEVPVTGITLDKNEASVVEGATVTLTATVSPENATDPTVTWSSSNEEVATVVDGVVTGVKAGTATITAQAGEKTATCKVTVTAAEVPVTDITLNQNEASVVEGETVTLTATVLPENATNPAVTWSSSDESVATVVDGVVTGVKAGTATITAKAGEKTATCEVTVTAAEVPEEDIEIVGGSEDEPVAEVSSSIETSVNDDGEETKTATLTVVSEKTNSAGEVVDNPCVVIVKNPDGSYEKLEAEENPDGGYDYVKEDYTEAMEFIVAVEGDYTGDGEFKTIDLAKANLDIIAKKDMDPVKVLIMGSANGKLRTIDLAKLNLILVNEDQN